VYSLLFADAGLSTARISTLFVIWSVVSFVFEVPSGPGPMPGRDAACTRSVLF